MRDGLARAVTQIREVMLDLHPVQLQVGGLESALRAICTQQAAAGRLRVPRSRSSRPRRGRRDELVLSLGARAAAQRRQARRRPRGRSCAWRSRDEGVRLEVTDDGTGFAPDRLREALGQGHIGLASSRERAEAIGGTFRVGPRDDGRPGTQARRRPALLSALAGDRARDLAPPGALAVGLGARQPAADDLLQLPRRARSPAAGPLIA